MCCFFNFPDGMIRNPACGTTLDGQLKSILDGFSCPSRVAREVGRPWMANSSRSWTRDLDFFFEFFSSNFFLRIFVFRNLFFGNLFFGNFASEIFASEIFASEIFASLPPIPFPFPPLLLSSSTLLLLQVPLCSDLACSSSSYLSVATWPPETPRPVADTWSVRIIAQWKTLQKRPKALADPDHRRKSSYQDLTQASTSSIFAISTDCRMADKGMLLFRCIPSRGSF